MTGLSFFGTIWENTRRLFRRVLLPGWTLAIFFCLVSMDDPAGALDLAGALQVGHSLLWQCSDNLPVLADTIFINHFKSVERLHKCHHCWIYPCDGFDDVRMLALEVAPIPDWFMMKYSVSKRSDSVEAFGEILSDSDVAWHIGDNWLQ